MRYRDCPEMTASGLPLPQKQMACWTILVTPGTRLDMARRTNTPLRVEKVTLPVDLLLRARKAEEASRLKRVAREPKGKR
jgi:hypothetical protein